MRGGPIYLAGADRSGTTLMSAILSSHPNIGMARLGSNMFTFFYGKFGDLSRRDNFERCLAALLKYKHVQILNPDAERIRREFWAGKPSYARLFALLNAHYAGQMGKTRWGDKTSYIERYADPILADDPTAQFVHMVRDPRDRYASSITKYKRQRGRVGGATARWLYSMRLARRSLQRYPANYLVVRYENLAARPEETVRQVCAFLGEEYAPSMLAMGGAEQFLNRGGNSSYGDAHGGISTASIGRFRKVLSKGDLAFMQSQAGAEMAAYDYRPERLRLSWSEQLSYYLVEWPTGRALMAAWRALETLQHNFPAQFGRRPVHSRDGAEEKEFGESQTA